MNRRPLSLTIVGWLFIVVGVGAVVHHGSEFKPGHLLERDLVLACGVSLLAAIGGAFLLRGRNWARWLLTLWMAFHIGLSLLHNLTELAVHVVFFSILGYFLFRPQASAYFRAAATRPVPVPAAENKGGQSG